MISNILKHSYALSMGVFFAVLQTCYFFQLEIWVTAAYPGFLTITVAWLAGSGLGLWLANKHSGHGLTPLNLTLWLAASVLAFYLSEGLCGYVPFRIEMLWIHGILIGVSGAQAGHFFAAHSKIFNRSSTLFFMENNGFVVGWILGFLGYISLGIPFANLAPVALAGLLVGLWTVIQKIPCPNEETAPLETGIG
ncbi:MAG: hypothetical protein HY751_12720 [Nitrospinae bacterium]|nr:hypothetical protein [Nitrospinota bacterium]